MNLRGRIFFFFSSCWFSESFPLIVTIAYAKLSNCCQPRETMFNGRIFRAEEVLDVRSDAF